MAKTLKDLSAAIELEAAQSGNDATAELARFRAYYRLARQLTDRRTELAMSQQELAKRCGVRQSEISKIESGRANPTVHTLTAIAGALGAEISLTASTRRLRKSSITASRAKDPRRRAAAGH